MVDTAAVCPIRTAAAASAAAAAAAAAYHLNERTSEAATGQATAAADAANLQERSTSNAHERKNVRTLILLLARSLARSQKFLYLIPCSPCLLS